MILSFSLMSSFFFSFLDFSQAQRTKKKGPDDYPLGNWSATD